ncbi:MAG TPA: VWA domain-containing protein [Thermoanaerobaculia bacterium]|nr:VWA domain-containing protein [Thermoanaerobaculia bacterium]
MTTFRAAAVAVIVLLAGTPVLAQKFGEAVQVSIVEVPVTVVDRDGKAVRGLTRADFELYDEGKRVPIDYFETVDMSAIAGTGPSSRRLPPVATRNFLLLFDLENSEPGFVARAQEAAAHFIDSGLDERDLLAVAIFTAERGVQLLTSFTGDRVLVRTAVETLGQPQRFRVADPLMLSGEPVDGPVRGAVADGNLQINDASRKFNDVEARNRLRILFGGLGRVARTLHRLHGQKQVVFLSEGFDARLVQGRSVGALSRQEMDQVFHGETHKIDSDERFGNAASRRDLDEMAELFRRAGVTMHAVDIAGVRSLQRGSPESLFLLTTPTGGTVYRNLNDLRENFGRILRQQELVYLIGFNARSTGTPGKYHALKVKTVAAQGARVTHRSGYFEPAPDIADVEKTLSLAEIVVNDLPIDDVAVSISATAMPGPNGKVRVPVVVELPGKRLLDGVSTPTATATLFLYAFDAQNRVYDHLEQRIALDIAQAGESVRASGIRYYGTLRVPAGEYALKALVRVEESGRIGFTRSDLRVPAFDSAVVLPPLLFVAPEKWLMLNGPSRGDEFPYPFSAGDAKYVPRSRPELRNGGEYELALFLYHMPVEGLGLLPVIASLDGATTRTADVSVLGRTAADERGGTKLLLSFRTAGLAAGDYELRLTVTPTEGSASVVSMPFVLR